jgi:hypothetical protein
MKSLEFVYCWQRDKIEASYVARLNAETEVAYSIYFTKTYDQGKFLLSMELGYIFYAKWPRSTMGMIPNLFSSSFSFHPYWVSN